MSKYFTIVIRADDEMAARTLTPGEIIRGNPIVACSLGHVLNLNDKFKDLIPREREADIIAAEKADLAPFGL